MTTIGASLTITGEITSHEDITIHGSVQGQIRMETGSLLIAPKGKVGADVRGTRVTIHGTLEGNVDVTERVELTPSAVVNGTLTAPSVVLQDGATFNGLLDMAPAARGKGGAKNAAEVAKAS